VLDNNTMYLGLQRKAPDIFDRKVRVKFTLEQATKTQRWIRAIVILIH